MNSANTKLRTITIKKKDLFFDMDMMSLGLSEVSGGDSQRRADRIALDTSSDNGRRTATRLCDHRLSDVRQLLEKFIDPLEDESFNNLLGNEDYVIPIRITVEAEDNIFPQIADLTHEYIVNGALADWYAQLGFASNRESLNNRAAESLLRIRELIYFRPMP